MEIVQPGGGSSELEIGTTLILSGTNGFILYDNNGVLGERADYWNRTVGSTGFYLSPHTTTDRLVLGGAADNSAYILNSKGSAFFDLGATDQMVLQSTFVNPPRGLKFQRSDGVIFAAIGDIYDTNAYGYFNDTANSVLLADGTYAINATGNSIGTAWITSGGTSSQFLKGDGSLDSSTYLTSVALTATYIGYGSVGNVLTGSSALTWTSNLFTITGTAITDGLAITGKILQTGITGAGTQNAFGSGVTLASGNGGDSATVTAGRGGVISIMSGNGGNTTAASALSGVGGNFVMSSGNSGNASAASGTSNCNAAGSFNMTSGTGGTSTATGTASGKGGAGGTVSLTSGAGGPASGSTSSSNTGGAGGNFGYTVGGGGNAINGGTTNKGGLGGSLTISTGTGGYAYTSGSGTTNTGGDGGALSFSSSRGGTAAGGSVANIGGDGGTITFSAGLGAAGSGTGAVNGLNGNIIFKSGTTEIARFLNSVVGNVGNFGLGVATPTALLHFAAGTSTAGTAPLKFTSGPLTTVAVAAQMEYLSGQLYFTDATPTRHMVAMSPTLGLSVTIVTAQLTALGAQGSQTFVNGILTAQVQAT